MHMSKYIAAKVGLVIVLVVGLVLAGGWLRREDSIVKAAGCEVLTSDIEGKTFKMRSIVDRCGLDVEAAVDAVLAYPIGTGGKTLFFAAGRGYDIKVPIQINKSGITFIGEPGSSFVNATYTDTQRGTLFNCAISAGDACIDLVMNGNDPPAGFTFSNIAMKYTGWDTGAEITGIRSNSGNRILNIKDSAWINFPGNAISLLGTNVIFLDNLIFQSNNQYSKIAINIEHNNSQAPNAISIQNVQIHGSYDKGIKVVGGSGVTIRDSFFEGSIQNPIYFDTTIHGSVEGCRFEVNASKNTESAPAIEVTRSGLIPGKYPDVVIRNNYFDHQCVANRYPIAMSGATGNVTTMEPRVLLDGNTFKGTKNSIFTGTSLYATNWQCANNMIYNRTQSSPAVHSSVVVGSNECQTFPTNLPPAPSACYNY